MQNNNPETLREGAGFFVRLGAYMIDMIVISFLLFFVRIIIWIISLQSNFLNIPILFKYSMAAIILYLIQVSYFIITTKATRTTIGKKLFKLEVIADENEFTTFNIVFRETVGRFLSGVFLGAGYIMIGLDSEKRGLHDIMCNTRVVYAEKPQ